MSDELRARLQSQREQRKIDSRNSGLGGTPLGQPRQTASRLGERTPDRTWQDSARDGAFGTGAKAKIGNLDQRQSLFREMQGAAPGKDISGFKGRADTLGVSEGGWQSALGRLRGDMAGKPAGAAPGAQPSPTAPMTGKARAESNIATMGLQGAIADNQQRSQQRKTNSFVNAGIATQPPRQAATWQQAAATPGSRPVGSWQPRGMQTQEQANAKSDIQEINKWQPATRPVPQTTPGELPQPPQSQAVADLSADAANILALPNPGLQPSGSRTGDQSKGTRTQELPPERSPLRRAGAATASGVWGITKAIVGGVGDQAERLFIPASKYKAQQENYQRVANQKRADKEKSARMEQEAAVRNLEKERAKYRR
jgi:hypothetical protein